MKGRYEIVCETRRGFHASLGRGDPCTQYKRRGGTSSLLEGIGGDLPLPSGEVDVSPRAAGEGARIQLDACALTRAVGATSPEGRGNSEIRNKVGF